jgi:Uma2 family endonuclease
MATQPTTFITPEQYLERERAAATKSEYYRGEMFAMAGASVAHNLIVANLVTELNSHLGNRDCLVFPSDMRLLVSASGLYTYPDVMVVCGGIVLADQQGDVLTNPVFIVEVLSESTKDYDRAGKFNQYMGIPTFKEYLTVSQSEKIVDHWVRQTDGSWLYRQVSTGIVHLSSLEMELSVAAIYNRVKI